MSRRFVDITGERYGRLIVLRHVGFAENHQSLWECQCDCGKTHIVPKKSLTGGGTKSCGCLRSERTKIGCTKHGMITHSKRAKIYDVWVAMKQRCTNPNNKYYRRYGGRGIRVCQEWINDFKAFYDWSIANGYSEGLHLDRIDNDGSYSPDNCHWITNQENQKNKTHNNQYTVCK